MFAAIGSIAIQNNQSHDQGRAGLYTILSRFGGGMSVTKSKLTHINVVCIKWGSKYPNHYVNRLYQGVRTNLNRPFSFHCFTDNSLGLDSRISLHPLPVEAFEDQLVAAMNRNGRRGAWRKISLFKPGLANLTGPMLYLDLDVLITGDLGIFVDLAGDKVSMRREWRYERIGREGGHGSVEVFNTEYHSFLYSEFASDPIGSVERHRGSEQYYTSMTALRHQQLNYFPGDLIRSFKRDSMRFFPSLKRVTPEPRKNCRVICFHGDPNMDVAVNGYRSSLLRFTEPAPWIEKYWRDSTEFRQDDIRPSSDFSRAPSTQAYLRNSPFTKKSDI